MRDHRVWRLTVDAVSATSAPQVALGVDCDASPGLDARIAPLVSELNTRGLRTWSSCAGHPDEFSLATWWPWIYLAPIRAVASPILLPFDRLDESALGETTGAMERSLKTLIDGYYRVHGVADDEIGPMVYRLTPSTTFVLAPTGVDPRGMVTRWMGEKLGAAGRRDFYARSWREFEMLTLWLSSGERATYDGLSLGSPLVVRRRRWPYSGDGPLSNFSVTT